VAELRSELVEVKSQLAEAKSQLAEARGRLEQVQQIDQDTVSALTSKLQEQQAEIVELKAKLD
jgi:ABC-type transporter Mla MlaB component